ncbi:MAG: helix-turn-helix transcriptional regulator [Rhodospirillaceae bacterium]|nr:helix-turn-helix transcriptional regulator [Rhodospirillaceae bacterium]
MTAALDCFAERGFAATRLDDIAARAGVTKGTLYLYFPSKKELFKAVVRQFLVPLLDSRETEDADPGVTSAELIRRLLLSVPETLAGSPVAAIPRLLLAEAHNFPDLARFYFEEVPLRARRRVARLVRRGMERGEFRAIDPDHAFYCAVSPLIMTVLWRSVFGPFDPEAPDLAAVARAQSDILLNGLLRREPPE